MPPKERSHGRPKFGEGGIVGNYRFGSRSSAVRHYSGHGGLSSGGGGVGRNYKEYARSLSMTGFSMVRRCKSLSILLRMRPGMSPVCILAHVLVRIHEKVPSQGKKN